MALVDYSDSDGSDNEVAPTAKAAQASAKTGFQKVVDRSNPGKIRVSLPQAASKDANNGDEPSAKRAKMGNGLGGFNSFLPAPKRTGQAGTTTLGGNVKKGLGSGVSLKTGSAPGFSRDPEPDRHYVEEGDTESTSNSVAGLSLPPPKSENVEQKPSDEVKFVGKPLMFRPLSVSRKLQKKKKQNAGTSSTTTTTLATPVTPAKVEKPATKPKVSLFSMSAETKNPVPVPNGEYQPMMLEPEEAGQNETASPYGVEPSYEEYTPNVSHIAPPAVPTPPISQSLDDIAGDLHLSAAERRQLFGRQKGGRGQGATKIINFNTDQEYLHNEELRATGEQVTHNPVRSIAPGKHSLKQLVNAAQSQKEALEESFAKGKSNRAEASSRYGW
jgi:hypothetical protein